MVTPLSFVPEIRGELADEMQQRYIERTAENAMIEIQRLSEKERERWGSLLARSDLLRGTGYLIVHERGLREEDDYGLIAIPFG